MSSEKMAKADIGVQDGIQTMPPIDLKSPVATTTVRKDGTLKTISAEDQHALFAAVGKGEHEEVTKLLNENPDLAGIKQGDKSIVDIAVENGHPEVVQAIVDFHETRVEKATASLELAKQDLQSKNRAFQDLDSQNKTLSTTTEVIPKLAPEGSGEKIEEVHSGVSIAYVGEETGSQNPMMARSPKTQEVTESQIASARAQAENAQAEVTKHQSIIDSSGAALAEANGKMEAATQKKEAIAMAKEEEATRAAAEAEKAKQADAEKAKQAEAEKRKTQETALFDAVKAGKIDDVKALLAEHPTLVDIQDDAGKTPLHYAAANVNLEMSNILVKAGADQKIKDSSGKTADQIGNGMGLISAIKEGRIDHVKEYLREDSTLVSVADKDGKTALHHAAEQGNTEIATALIAADTAKTTLNVRDNSEKMPIHYAAEQGNEDLFNALKTAGAMTSVSIRKEDKEVENSTPEDLLKAAQERKAQEAERVAAEAKAKEEATRAAAEAEKAKQADAEKAKQAEAEKRKTQETALFDAVKAGKIDDVKALLAEHPTLVDIQDDAGKTPLHYAAANVNLEMSNILVKAGADQKIKDSSGKTADQIGNGMGLISAIKEGRIDHVKEYLREDSTLVSVADKDGKTALHHAAEQGNTEIATALIAADTAKTTLNVRDNSEKMPIHYAAEQGNEDLFNALKTAGAMTSVSIRKEDKEVENSTPEDLLKAAQERKAQEAERVAAEAKAKEEATRAAAEAEKAKQADAEKAKQAEAEKRKTQETALFDAVKAGKIDDVKALLAEHPTLVDIQDDAGKTPLHYAAANVNLEMSNILVKAGADQKIKDSSGKTADQIGNGMGLISAIKEGRIDHVKEYLREDSTLVSVADKDGKTALHHAAEQGNTEIATALIAADTAKTTLNVRDNSEKMPIHYAAEQGNEDLFNALKTAGAMTSVSIRKEDKEVENSTPEDLLKAAQERKAQEAERVAAEAKAKEEATRAAAEAEKAKQADAEKAKQAEAEKRKTQETALFDAVKAGKIDDVKALLAEHPTLVDIQDDAGKTPLHYAAANVNLEMSNILVKAGADQKIKDSSGKTADQIGNGMGLISAIKEGRIDHVKEYLREDSTLVSVADKDGKTALHHAAEQGNTEIATALIAADTAKTTLNVRDNSEKMPIHYAAEQGNEDLFNALKTAGAMTSVSIRKEDKEVENSTPEDLLKAAQERKAQEAERVAAEAKAKEEATRAAAEAEKVKQAEAEKAKQAEAERVAAEAKAKEAEALKAKIESQAPSVASEHQPTEDKKTAVEYKLGSYTKLQFEEGKGGHDNFTNGQRPMSKPEESHVVEHDNGDGTFSYSVKRAPHDKSDTKIHKVEGQFGEIVFNADGKMIDAKLDKDAHKFLSKEQLAEAQVLDAKRREATRAKSSSIDLEGTSPKVYHAHNIRNSFDRQAPAAPVASVAPAVGHKQTEPTLG